MAEGRLFSNDDLQQVLRLIREGKSIKQAAQVVQFSETTVYKHLSSGDEVKQLVREARATASEILADDVRAEMRRRALDPDVFDEQPAISQRALERLYDGAAPPRVEVNVNQPLTELMEGRRPVSISDVAELASRLGIRIAIGVDGGDARPALPAAQDVLPDPAAD